MKCYVMCGIRLYVHSSFVKRVCLFRDASPDVWCLSLCWKEGGHKSRGLWGFLRGSCQTGLSEEGKLFCPCDARCVLTGHDLQDSCGTLDGDFDLNWEAEKELEAMACDGEDFIPPKIMLISSKVPKAEYVPTIIRRDDPSIIPILYDHEHATFDDILEEIEKKLNIYRKGCKIWKMLIFCQGGPGHLYLLKNKVATFAKVEKEEDMILFWKRLSRLMSKINPEPNIIHIMGCYVLGNPNGEKLFQNLKNLMNPYRVAFESPLELSAQGKQMIETYFDFRLYRLWKTRQHSKLLDYDDIL